MTVASPSLVMADLRTEKLNLLRCVTVDFCRLADSAWQSTSQKLSSLCQSSLPCQEEVQDPELLEAGQRGEDGCESHGGDGFVVLDVEVDFFERLW